MEKVILDTIKPETDLEKRILDSQVFVDGALYGKARHGHPEGQVIYHIGEVLKNIDKYGTPETREKLRLIALIHDTFKHKVNRSQPMYGDNHHAMIARRFAEKFTVDTEILDVIELHDGAYNSWKKEQHYQYPLRAKKLIDRLGKNIDLYLVFFRCDNETGDKTQECYIWFENLVNQLDQYD